MTAVAPRRRPVGIAYIDGRRARRAMHAGLRYVIGAQDHLNKINVYPVADGDTGTNLALTMASIHAALDGNTSRHAGEVFMLIADAALDGARGNSGAILAQFLQGVSDSLSGQTRVDAAQFAKAMEQGERYARDALSTPVEGTVLSVMRDFAVRVVALTATEAVSDFVPLWRRGLATALDSLAATPTQLDVLRRAGVVDAGADGFVTMLRGIQEFIHAGDLTTPAPDLPAGIMASAFVAGEAVDLEFRFCTECVVRGEGIDRRHLKEALMPLGGSMVLAGTHSKTRIHIHANEPGEVFKVAAQFGQVSGTKADDMQQQQAETHRADRRVAVMMDSAGDMPDDVMERLNIHMTPLRIHFGDESFLDKVTISADDFYAKLRTSAIYPKTSQPVPGDYRRDYQYLASHYQSVVNVTVMASVSGTHQSALSAAQRSSDPERIHVHDSNSVSIGQGMMAIHAAECAQAGLDAPQICAELARIGPLTKIYGLVPDLDAAVRGGRIRPIWKRLVELFALTPILAIRKKGGVGVGGVLIGRANKLDKFIRFTLKRVDQNKTYRIAVGHTANEADAQHLLTALQAGIRNIDTSYFCRVGSALGVHAGPDAVLVGLQEYTRAPAPAPGG